MPDYPLIDVSQFNELDEGNSYHHAPFFNSLLQCRLCSCRDEAQRVVIGSGTTDAHILFLGRNPGKDEDALGVPFIGKGGMELDTWLEILNLDRQKVVITNLNKCHTLRDRPPKPIEKQICGETWFTKELEYFFKVTVIFTLGNDATKFVLGPEAASTGQLMFYHVVVKLGSRLFCVIPLAHPGYLIRARQHLARMYEDVLPPAREFLKEKIPNAYYASCRSS
jgi:DNA polymerase